VKDEIQFPSGGRAFYLRSRAFTLLELLVVVAVIGILASLLLPALTKAKGRGQSIYCLNNLKQLNLGWLMYAHDNGDRLAYNVGATELQQLLAQRQTYNWADSLLNWELDANNTNLALNTDAGLGQYVSRNAQVYKCPADHVLSSIQRKAGWPGRSRSISLNAMVGDAGEFTRSGANVNNPDYRQFFKLGDIANPSGIFTFIEEHPDSINDGYFLNKISYPGWTDLPASYHNGSANLAFSDGHTESHTWLLASSRPPARPDAASLPFQVSHQQRTDLDWLLRRTSVYSESDSSSEQVGVSANGLNSSGLSSQ
jgi:prepilin-type N-terminal cleavage/methylation domain-containing protein/prepilin-type processing-associated H-X9-DG protein